MYMSYILQISKSGLSICASINQLAKLGLLDLWRWDRQFSWNIRITHLCCITSQKSKELICTMAEARYHEWYYQFFLWSRGWHIL